MHADKATFTLISSVFLLFDGVVWWTGCLFHSFHVLNCMWLLMTEPCHTAGKGSFGVGGFAVGPAVLPFPFAFPSLSPLLHLSLKKKSAPAQMHLLPPEHWHTPFHLSFPTQNSLTTRHLGAMRSRRSSTMQVPPSGALLGESPCWALRPYCSSYSCAAASAPSRETTAPRSTCLEMDTARPAACPPTPPCPRTCSTQRTQTMRRNLLRSAALEGSRQASAILTTNQRTWRGPISLWTKERAEIMTSGL